MTGPSFAADVWDVVVVGAGAAGMVAATRAAGRGCRTLLLEKNRKAGVKILMSGGSRCNLTHDTDAAGIAAAYDGVRRHQGRFLRDALAAFGPRDVLDLFHRRGVRTKTEPGGKVFPVSDSAVQVQRALLAMLHDTGATLALEEPVLELSRTAAGFALVTPRRSVATRQLVVTVGGESYPGCGTCGDGYPWARILGHTVVHPRPALVPITTPTEFVGGLQGVTVPDAQVAVRDPEIRSARKSVLGRQRGSFLFTHFGLSGPAALNLSGRVSSHEQPRRLLLDCDFVPHLDDDDLKVSLAPHGRRTLLTAISDHLPRRLAEAILTHAGLATDRRCAELPRADRLRLLDALKHLELPVTGTTGFRKAEVTAGGVALREVDPKTMESRLIPGLHWAGEILDLDGPIGGYNFQAAFSTGWTAGSAVRPT